MDRRELRPWWLDSINAPLQRYPTLHANIAADVVVIGAGITGLTTAYLLARQGRQVVLVEAGKIGDGESGRSTAHVTYAIDAPLPWLVAHHGLDQARTIWDGTKLGLDMIDHIVATENIDCQFQRVAGYLVTYDGAEELLDYERLVREIGHECHVRPAVGLKKPPEMALCFPRQARLHPLQYLSGLAHAFYGAGGAIYEDTRIVEVHDSHEAKEGVRLVTDAGHTVRGKDVVVASHVPINNRIAIHTKQASYRTYVIGLRIAKDSFADILLADTASPYHYVRLQPGTRDDLLLVGGEDHKTGQDDEAKGSHHFQRLLDFARLSLGVDAPIVSQWSGQIIESTDRLPYIGLNVHARHEYVATGFGGDGTTFGTLAGHMISEHILGRTTPWDGLFAPQRFELSSLKQFFDENKDYPAYMLKGWLATRSAHTPAQLAPGEGDIFKLGGRRVAISRDAQSGALLAVSPACTHLGCCVAWNAVEHTWDCPCHGSRFAADGAVINGPAVACLEKISLEPVAVDDEKLGDERATPLGAWSDSEVTP